MNKDREKKSRRFRLKILLLLEVVICYMALLNLVSHSRGPERYRVLTGTPLVTISDFIGFDGSGSEQGLVLENQIPGTAVGYQAELPLIGLEGIYISFSVDCPPEYAGSVLITDLYDFESGYDSPEQEYQLTLQPGVNELEVSLRVSENAPSKAQLRIFTTDIADYSLNNLHAHQEQSIPKITAAMAAAAIISFAAIVVTSAAFYRTCAREVER